MECAVPVVIAYVTAALDQTSGDAGLLLPGAKYEVARALPESPTQQANVIVVKALPEAA